jgi:hypothetical protein
MIGFAKGTDTIYQPQFVICGNTETLEQRLDWPDDGGSRENEDRAVVFVDAAREYLESQGFSSKQIKAECRFRDWHGGRYHRHSMVTVIWTVLTDDESEGDWDEADGVAAPEMFAKIAGYAADGALAAGIQASAFDSAIVEMNR